MKIEVLTNAAAVARKAAAMIAAQAHGAGSARGRFVMAVSVATLHGSCSVPWQTKKSLGKSSTWTSWRSAWR
jgi:hypothetical protein